MIRLRRLYRKQMASDASNLDPAATVDGPELPDHLTRKLRISVPGYELLDKIASGGQATVYRARELTSGLTVAIKVLNGGINASDGARERLLREAAALRALNDPNIVCVIEAGRTSVGLDFIVMNYVDGRPLDALWTDRKFAAAIAPEPPAKLRLFKRICEVVQSAHLKGITHRDLSPSNILITADGEPHILDFGLASTAFDHILSAGRNVTVTGQFIGKVKYASPEQARGSHDAIDIRTDVYALGVILYQILTDGAFPYEVVGALVDVLNNIIHIQPLPPSNKLQGQGPAKPTRRKEPPLVNETIEAVVLKALEKNPADRYQSAGALAADIHQYLDGKPTAAVSKRRNTTRIIRLARRRHLVAALVSFAVLAVILINIRTIGAWFGLSMAASAPTAALPTTATAADHSASRSPHNPDSGFWMNLLDPEHIGGWTASCKVNPMLSPDANGVVEVNNAVCVWGGQVADASIRASVRKTSGQNLCLILRDNEKGSKYFAWCNGDGWFGIAVVVNGRDQGLATVRIPGNFNEFFNMQFSTAGEVLSLNLNGEQILHIRDSKLRTGRAGISAYRGMSQFKDIQLQVLDKEPQIPTNPQPPVDDKSQCTPFPLQEAFAKKIDIDGGDGLEQLKFGSSPVSVAALIGHLPSPTEPMPVATEYTGAEVHYFWASLGAYFPDHRIGNDSFSSGSYVCFLFEHEKLTGISFRFANDDLVLNQDAIFYGFARINGLSVTTVNGKRTFSVDGRKIRLAGSYFNGGCRVDIEQAGSPRHD